MTVQFAVECQMSLAGPLRSAQVAVVFRRERICCVQLLTWRILRDRFKSG